MRRDRGNDFVGRETAEGPAPFLHHHGTHDAGYVTMHGVSGFEGQHTSSRAAEGEQNGLEHFVRPVCDEDLIGTHAVQLSDVLTQSDRPAIGVAMKVDRTNLIGEKFLPLHRRGKRTFVGVEPHIDVHLRRVVALKSRQVLAGGQTTGKYKRHKGGNASGRVPSPNRRFPP